MIKLNKNFFFSIILFCLAFNVQSQTVSDKILKLQQDIERIFANSSDMELPNNLYYGTHYSNLLEAFKVTTKVHSKKPVSKLPRRLRATLRDLEHQLYYFKEYNGKLTRDDVLRLNETHKRLPFYMQIPNLFLDNVFIVGDTIADNTIKITLKGKFPNSDTPDKWAYLKHGEFKVDAISQTFDEIKFSFKPSELNLTFDSLSYNYQYLNVYIPYIINYNNRIGHYRLLIWSMPSMVGSIDFTDRHSSTSKAVQHKSTSMNVQASLDRDINKEYCVPNHKGWKLVPNSVELIIDKSIGERGIAWTTFKNSTGNCYTVETYFTNSGKSGMLNFRLEYDIVKYTSHNSEELATKYLTWGQSVTFDTQSKDWEAKFKSYNGNIYSLNLNEKNDYSILITETDNQITFSTPTIDQLINPNTK